MKKSLFSILLLTVSVLFAAPDQIRKGIDVDAPVVRVALFKNGLALVTRRLQIPAGAATLTLKSVPQPVHGTFWVESLLEPVFTVRKRELTRMEENRSDLLDWRHVFAQLAGKKVRLVLGENNIIAGTVQVFPAASDRWICVRTVRGVEMVEPGRIQRLVVEDEKFVLKPEVTRQKKTHTETVLRISLKAENKSRALEFSYLARWATWAPAYRLDLAETGPALLGFSAVVKNEICDWKQTRLFLVSGFPALLYERVTSPMAPDQSLQQFFAALSGGGPSYNRNRSVMAQVAYNVGDSAMGGAGAVPDFSGTDSDFHVRDMGVVDLEKGSSAWLSLGSQALEVAKTVEWVIPDSRDERGRPRLSTIQPDNNDGDPVWDTYTFNNPFSFPMTTAPLAVYRQGQVMSQNLCRWTPPGQKARVRATRALNIHVEHEEEEVKGSREVVMISGDDHRKVKILGTLTVENRRPLPQTLVITRTLWGHLVNAEGNPKKTLLSEGARSVNERTRLEWSFELKAGETRRLTYAVEVLVDI